MLEHVKPGSVLFGYITGGHNLNKFNECLHELRDMDAQNLKLLNSLGSATGPFHEDNRNKVVDMAMARPRVEYLVWVDTDIEFKPVDIYSLLYAANDTDHRIVAGLYFGKPGWSDKWWPQWYEFNEIDEFTIVDKLDGRPLQRIDGAGMGICVMHMSVFREFPEVDHNWRWFGRDPWTVDGKIERFGEDLTFFLRCNRRCYPGYERWSNLPPKKIEVWGHRGVAVKHHKEQAIGVEEYLAQGTVTRMRASEGQAAEAPGLRVVGGNGDGGPEPAVSPGRVIKP